MKVNIPTLKRGTKYGPEYVNRTVQCERHPQATAVRRRPGKRWIR